MKILNYCFFLFVIGILSACSSESNSVDDNVLVPVQVTFSGLDVSVVPDGSRGSVTRATASEAKVDRIAFKVFDASGKNVYYSVVKEDPKAEDFGMVKCLLHVGTYKFVAVAHKAKTAESKAAVITSPTEATLGEANVPSCLYSKVTDVTVSGNTTQDVTIAFGKRITSSFDLNVTDAYPDEIETVELILNPLIDKTEKEYVFNPTTGLAESALTYNASFNRKSFSVTSFTGKTLSISLFLTAEEQKMNVTINMKNSDGTILYTRTLKDVTFRQRSSTIAKGTFFSSQVSGSFTFDTTDDTSINIPLKPLD